MRVVGAGSRGRRKAVWDDDTRGRRRVREELRLLRRLEGVGLDDERDGIGIGVSGGLSGTAWIVYSLV